MTTHKNEESILINKVNILLYEVIMDLTVTNLTLDDIKQAFRNELETFFTDKNFGESQVEKDEIGNIDLAIEITGLAKPTIYGLVSERKIPHLKQGKRLYFSKLELIEWIKQGKRKTQSEIKLEAENFGKK